MNTRLRQIREETGLSRVSFGKTIGVSGDVINNLERGRVDIKEPIIKLICSEFSVNENWFRTGEGDMFVGASSSLLDQLSKEYHLDEAGQRLLFSFLNLNAEKRKIVLNYVKQTIDLFNSGILQSSGLDGPSEQ